MKDWGEIKLLAVTNYEACIDLQIPTEVRHENAEIRPTSKSNPVMQKARK